MRLHHLFGIIVLILIGFGVKLLFFSAPTAQANIRAETTTGMNIFQMHVEHPRMKDLPLQVVRDPI